ncbi:hypothetical protein CEXT_570321 [Caerostris extrusa]|uniref:Uncharacterized protein n=1 Tax=Caerostris extrusa TaxID=172846 RepID=A0AAV4QCT4_CAEEX|nr:hypothetical protein CEXT_570321 [Caerostris extrusa]
MYNLQNDALYFSILNRLLNQSYNVTECITFTLHSSNKPFHSDSGHALRYCLENLISNSAGNQRKARTIMEAKRSTRGRQKTKTEGFDRATFY